MMRSPIVVLAVVVAAGGVLAGCSPTASPSGSPSSAASSTPSTTPSASSTATASAGSSCTRDQVAITYQALDASAGHFHGVLIFGNSGSTTCTLDGYPIVYFRNSEAEQTMGPAATNDTSQAPTTVTLGAGQSAQAAVTITDAGVAGGCAPVDSTALIVAVPITHAFDLATDGRDVPIASTATCGDSTTNGLLQVGPITAG